MLRSRSSLLFALVFGLSLALLVWWTAFQVAASRELADASDRLAARDIPGAVRALGAEDATGLHELADRRRTMFASEGAFFVIVLLGLAALYVGSVRRESAAQRSQDRFLAGTTHELKTPLATIRLLLESLRDERVPAEKRAKYLATGLQEAERLERGLDNVLTAAGLRGSGRRPHNEAGDLVGDLRAAVDALHGRALAGNVTLTIEAPQQLPWQRDGAAIQLVLRNLLDNAIKYTPRGGEVRVRVGREGDTCRVVVADSGRGIPPEAQARIFDRFYRAVDGAGADGTSPAGAGLGLAIARWVAEAHGGSLALARSDRTGSEFVATLPA